MFSDSKSAGKYIQQRLADHVDPELAGALADEVAYLYTGQTEHNRPLIIKSAKWVIRDDDLDILGWIAEGVKSAASGGLIGIAMSLQDLGSLSRSSQNALVGVCVSIFVSVLLLVRRLRKKGVRLNERQIEVICLLQSTEGLRYEELSAAINKANQGTTDDDQLRHTLASLQAVALGDGTIAEVISIDMEGIWRAAGV